MVGRDTVTFRFRLDAKEMQRLIKALEADARRFGGTMERVSGQSNKLGTGLKTTGNDAAAAAVNFQTATQGMLNLSTAAVQTFTSISNLDRAANRLAQSKIAVARAEDLLAAKQLRLNELQEKGLGHTSKAVNLTNELATARADLAVKNDKARIEEGALLDIQLLFVTNVANVMISSIQTIKTLRDMQAMSTIKAVAAEKLMNLSFMKSIVLSKAAAGSYKGMTFAIKGLTFSVRGLMFALGPIALLITGVTVAMQAYEENWGGFKDAVQTALPFLKESNDDLDESSRILEEDRKQMEGYVSAIDSMGNSMKKLSAPHKLYLEMHRDAFLAMDKNSKLAAYYSSQLAGLRTGPQGFSTPSVGGGLPSSGGSGAGTTTTATTTSTVSSGGVGTPSTAAVAGVSGDLADPFGSGEQRFVFMQLPKQDKMNVLLNKAQGFMNQGNFGAANLYFAEHEKVKVKPVMETDPVKIWENMQKGVNPKETTFFGGRPEKMPDPLVTADMQKFRFGTDLFSMDRFDQTHADTQRGEIMNQTGVDIGNIANVIDKNDAIRISNLQRSMSQFRNTTGGRADLAIAAVGGNATAAYQVPRGSIRASQGFYDGIRRKDSFNNGLGGLIMNQINNLKGSGRMVYSSSHRDIYKNKVTIPGRAIISQAIQMGMKGNSEFMDMINAIPDVDRESEDNMRQAYAAIGAASSIAEQYVNMINSSMSAIGFGSSMIARANTAGFSGHGLYHNIGLLAATKRTNFNNTEVVEESKSKLALTNSQIFAIRFNSTRGDAELQDRLRYVDQLESMSSGTSPL